MNKIGARVLTDNECNLILPSYEKIFGQVESIRKEAVTLQQESDSLISKTDMELDQKTNNIGILGCRGSGKTSLLKTVRKKILETNEESNDVALPIIIPENMSSNSTLMASILGMFSTIVEKRNKQNKERQSKELYICNGENVLVKKYNEVIKQYTYIQKDYRNILLNQFTSENDYVKQSAKVFNSDTEFIRKFNIFIDELLGTEGKKKEALLFIFIDDIDLSTYRCLDVVKTLLSYLSNFRIVTFISGDLETFEEALTLEFLRLEKALDKSLYDNSYLGDASKKLLDRKRILSYEYLKKIIPPVFRHSIKQWMLPERGNYTTDSKESTALGELLSSVLEKYIGKSYFRCVKHHFTDQEETLISHHTVYTYYLFDNTSRGLNNVYNVLFEIKERMNADGGIDLSDRKLLLETIVASNPVYNGMRERIFGEIIIWGITEEDSRIEFENARLIVDSLCKEPNAKKEEVFSLFILLDFAYRLLHGGNDIHTIEGYQDIKERALYILLSSTVVSKKICSDHFKESLPEKKENTELAGNEEGTLLFGVIEQKQEKFISYMQKKVKTDETKQEWYKQYSVFCRKEFILRILLDTPLDISLYLFEHLPMEKIVSSLNATAVSNEKEIVVILFQEFYYAVYSCCYLKSEEQCETFMQELLSNMYQDSSVIFDYIQDNVSKKPDVVVCGILLEELLKEAEEDTTSQQMKLTINTLYQLIKDIIQKLELKNETIDSFINQVLKNERFRGLFQDISYKKPVGKEEENNLMVLAVIAEGERVKYKERKRIIELINQNNLWRMEYSSSVKNYIKKEICAFLKAYKSEWEKINLSNLEESYKNFIASEKGVSKTKAKELQELAEELGVANDQGVMTSIDQSKYDTFYSRCSYMASNRYIWYGRYEAMEMRNALNECSYDYSESEDLSHLQFLLCSYIAYQSQEMKLVEISRYAEISAKLTALLSKAHEQADRTVLITFLDELNSGLEESGRITEKKINELFQ